MGSSSSKFKKYLHHGDEFAAMQIFQSSPELRKNLNPNLSYGEHHNHDTALHFAAKHGMKHLLRTFLNDFGGNPNKKNGSNETSLHAACQCTSNKNFSAMERRAACVSFIMQWRGAPVESGGREKIDLAAQDQNGNTALHLAAASGLEHCVYILTCAGSPLFIENNDKMTPCDMAVKNSHYKIAQLLESKMVFNDALDFHNEDELSQSIGETDEIYCGLRTQDLQEAKDQLLVETSDMLQVPLFTAEALLRDNEWSRELLLEKWMKDAVICCQLAGVEPPESAFSQSEIKLESNATSPPELQDNFCRICMLSMKESDRCSVRISCNHNFCFHCWEIYLSNKILEGMQHNILCPAYQCNILVPIDVIERLVSPDLARRYLHFDIKAFVENNKCIKWCPIAGCGRAVRLPETEQIQPTDELKNLRNGKPPPLISHAVDCGNGHFFCWECLGEAHAPSGCAQWRQWLDKVNQVRPEELNNDMKDLEDASNCLWLVSNSKPCPNCKSPIQKNEGCNHIKCSKCKFDFCWICLESWKKHSSATGGYFRCNRFPAASKADEKQGMLIGQAVARSQQIQELNRFLHYYTRFKNHEHSRKLEESLLTAVKHKMEVLASSLAIGKEVLSERQKNCTKFIEDGVRELLKARRVLCGSYVHGFYLEDHGYNKTIFEFMQNELETVTEKLSEMIARPYLKTPRHTIMQTTSLSRRKRHEFVRAVSKGLIPPETPPTVRKKKRFPGLLVMDHNDDEEMSHVIVASLKSLDCHNPWVKDEQGRHNNLSAMYEWPDYDSDEETEVSRALAVSLVGECSREGCNRPKARNPRTQALHEFCSLRCARNGIQLQSFTQDDSMDFIIALEMSRLQMIEDTIKRENQSAHKPNTSVSVTQTDSDADLSKAIELSIKLQKTDVGVTTEEIISLEKSTAENSIENYRQSNEDKTVNYFLKTLAGQNLQDNSQQSSDLISPSEEKTKKKELFRPRSTEDRFEISDIRGTCFLSDNKDEQCLRRVCSTGDLCHKNAKKDELREESRYHLDSNHSSQNDEKPEGVAQRILTGTENKNKTKSEHQDLRSQEYSKNSVIDEGACNQNSTDKTTIGDSLSADLDVCNILSSSETERISSKDEFLAHKLNSSFIKPADEIIAEPAQCENLQSVQNSSTNDHLKPSNIKKLRKSVRNRSFSDHDSPLRKIMDGADKKSKSVKDLIEEAKNTLRFIENANKSGEFRHSEVFSSANRTNWQTSIFDFDNTREFLRQCPERASTGKIKSNNYIFPSHSKSNAKSASALEGMKESEKQLISERFNLEKVLLLGKEKNLNEAQKNSFDAAGGEISHKKDSKSHSSKESLNKTGSNLRICIAKSSVATDSSNEYETDTGIPKSPTLYISGVSISRTPEPQDKKSPEHKNSKLSPDLKNLSHLQEKNNSSLILNLIPATNDLKDEAANTVTAVEEKLFPAKQFNDKLLSCVRQNRSSSLTVPRSESQGDSEPKSLNANCRAIPLHSNEKKDRKSSASSSPAHSITTSGQTIKIHFPTKNEIIFNSPNFIAARRKSDHENLSEAVRKSRKSKSASEPEREREMFRFPKSSTDGALSSVLHVQESTLSSDDFHEVLFLLERSSKHDSKRKKKSKKERDKVKENSSQDECTEVSSAL